jgi:hypothetical protein
VRAQDLTVRVRGPGGVLGTVDLDELGRFEVATDGPTSEGEYEYSANCTAPGGLEAENTTTLVVIRSFEPDLKVASIQLPPGVIATGRNLTIAVEINNLGFSAANTTMKAWEGGVGEGEPIVSRPVTVYTGLTISFNWTPIEPGQTTLVVELVEVDPSDANMSNNRRSITVEVRDVPDLVVVTVVSSNSEPYENTSITISVRLENLGGLNATCDIELYVDGLNESHRVKVNSDVLVPAGILTYSTFEWETERGVHRFYALATNVHPEEWNTDNNRASTKVSVKGPYEPEKPDEDGIPGSSATAAALATVAAVAILVLRRTRRSRPGP